MKKLAMAALLCTVGLTVGAGFWLLHRLPAIQARADVATERAAAQRIGMPLEFSQLQIATVPQRENAAPIYFKIGAILDELRATNPKSPLSNPLGFGGPTGPNPGTLQGQALRGFLAAHQSWPKSKEQLQRERDGALPELKPVFRLVSGLDAYPKVDFSKGAPDDFNAVSTLETLEKDLVIRADFQDRQGDWRGALKSMRSANRVASDSGFAASLTSVFVQESAYAITTREYVTLIARHSRDPAFLALVDLQLPQDAALPDLRNCLIGYMLDARSDFGTLNAFPTDASDDSSSVWSERVDTSAASEYIRSAEVQDRIDADWIRAWVLAWTRFPKDPHDWQGFKEALTYAYNVASTNNSKFNSVTRQGLSSLPGIMEVVGTIQARTRVLRASVALLRLRAARGDFPRSLPSSLGSIRIDPFDGHPLRYRPKAGGFILYSVGESGQDDGNALMAKAPTDVLRDGAVQFI